MALSRSRRSTSPQTHPRPDISRCMNLRYSLHTREIIIPSPLNPTLDHVAPQGHHLHDQPLALRRCHEVGSLSRAWGCHCSAYPRDVQGITTQKVSCSCIDFLKTLSFPFNLTFKAEARSAALSSTRRQSCTSGSALQRRSSMRRARNTDRTTRLLIALLGLFLIAETPMVLISASLLN